MLHVSLRVAALVSACVLVVSPPSWAQYFGPNKVRYEDFPFQVLQTAHFDIYYYPAEQRATDIAAVLAERWYKELSSALDHQFTTRQPLVLYASQSHFAQTTVIPAMAATRDVADRLERIVPDDLWPLPKYSEILFIK